MAAYIVPCRLCEPRFPMILLNFSRAVPPSVMWAQRNNVIFLTICLEDCKNPEIKIQNDKVYFHGVGGTEKKDHEVTIPLFKEIVPEVFIHNFKTSKLSVIPDWKI
jgi:prostaglandin-E synthase